MFCGAGCGGTAEAQLALYGGFEILNWLITSNRHE